MAVMNLIVNGNGVERNVNPRTNLADFLREDLRLTGTHVGCEHGVCGACTVLVDGLPIRSCITLAVACEGREVVTIEGFPQDILMGELREAFRTEHGLQCGFCTPGMLIACRDVVLRRPDASEREIREELAGNLCRCTGYIGIVNAVQKVMSARTGEPRPSQVIASLDASLPKAKAKSSSADSRVASPATSAATPTTTQAKGSAKKGFTRFSESFMVNESAAETWRFLSDFSFVASCIPGATLSEYGDGHLKGRMNVKIGPMTSSFAGSAEVALDNDRRQGEVRGAGSDGPSGSRTKALAVYSVAAVSEKSSRVDLSVDYSLQGPLAQFSRSGIAQAVGSQIVQAFAKNLNAKFDPQSNEVEPAELSGLGIFFAALKAWLRRLMGG